MSIHTVKSFAGGNPWDVLGDTADAVFPKNIPDFFSEVSDEFKVAIVAANRASVEQSVLVPLVICGAGLIVAPAASPVALALLGITLQKGWAYLANRETIISEGGPRNEEIHESITSLAIEIGGGLCGVGAARSIGGLGAKLGARFGSQLIAELGQVVGSGTGFHVVQSIQKAIFDPTANTVSQKINSAVNEMFSPSALARSILFAAINSRVSGKIRTNIDQSAMTAAQKQFVTWTLGNIAGTAATSAAELGLHQTGLLHSERYANVLQTPGNIFSNIARDLVSQTAMDLRTSAILDGSEKGVHQTVESLHTAFSDGWPDWGLPAARKNEHGGGKEGQDPSLKGLSWSRPIDIGLKVACALGALPFVIPYAHAAGMDGVTGANLGSLVVGVAVALQRVSLSNLLGMKRSRMSLDIFRDWLCREGEYSKTWDISTNGLGVDCSRGVLVTASAKHGTDVSDVQITGIDAERSDLSGKLWVSFKKVGDVLVASEIGSVKKQILIDDLLMRGVPMTDALVAEALPISLENGLMVGRSRVTAGWATMTQRECHNQLANDGLQRKWQEIRQKRGIESVKVNLCSYSKMTPVGKRHQLLVAGEGDPITNYEVASLELNEQGVTLSGVNRGYPPEQLEILVLNSSYRLSDGFAEKAAAIVLSHIARERPAEVEAVWAKIQVLHPNLKAKNLTLKRGAEISFIPKSKDMEKTFNDFLIGRGDAPNGRGSYGLPWVSLVERMGSLTSDPAYSLPVDDGTEWRMVVHDHGTFVSDVYAKVYPAAESEQVATRNCTTVSMKIMKGKIHITKTEGVEWKRAALLAAFYGNTAFEIVQPSEKSLAFCHRFREVFLKEHGQNIDKTSFTKADYIKWLSSTDFKKIFAEALAHHDESMSCILHPYCREADTWELIVKNSKPGGSDEYVSLRGSKSAVSFLGAHSLQSIAARSCFENESLYFPPTVVGRDWVGIAFLRRHLAQSRSSEYLKACDFEALIADTRRRTGLESQVYRLALDPEMRVQSWCRPDMKADRWVDLALNRGRVEIMGCGGIDCASIPELLIANPYWSKKNKAVLAQQIGGVKLKAALNQVGEILAAETNTAARIQKYLDCLERFDWTAALPAGEIFKGLSYPLSVHMKYPLDSPDSFEVRTGESPGYKNSFVLHVKVSHDHYGTPRVALEKVVVGDNFEISNSRTFARVGKNEYLDHNSMVKTDSNNFHTMVAATYDEVFFGDYMGLERTQQARWQMDGKQATDILKAAETFSLHRAGAPAIVRKANTDIKLCFGGQMVGEKVSGLRFWSPVEDRPSLCREIDGGWFNIDFKLNSDRIAFVPTGITDTTTSRRVLGYWGRSQSADWSYLAEEPSHHEFLALTQFSTLRHCVPQMLGFSKPYDHNLNSIDPDIFNGHLASRAWADRVTGLQLFSVGRAVDWALGIWREAGKMNVAEKIHVPESSLPTVTQLVFRIVPSGADFVQHAFGKRTTLEFRGVIDSARSLNTDGQVRSIGDGLGYGWDSAHPVFQETLRCVLEAKIFGELFGMTTSGRGWTTGDISRADAQRYLQTLNWGRILEQVPLLRFARPGTKIDFALKINWGKEDRISGPGIVFGDVTINKGSSIILQPVTLEVLSPDSVKYHSPADTAFIRKTGCVQLAQEGVVRTRSLSQVTKGCALGEMGHPIARSVVERFLTGDPIVVSAPREGSEGLFVTPLNVYQDWVGRNAPIPAVVISKRPEVMPGQLAQIFNGEWYIISDEAGPSRTIADSFVRAGFSGNQFYILPQVRSAGTKLSILSDRALPRPRRIRFLNEYWGGVPQIGDELHLWQDPVTYTLEVSHRPPAVGDYVTAAFVGGERHQWRFIHDGTVSPLRQALIDAEIVDKNQYIKDEARIKPLIERAQLRIRRYATMQYFKYFHYLGDRLSIDDLTTIGEMGMYRALRKFDASRAVDDDHLAKLFQLYVLRQGAYIFGIQNVIDRERYGSHDTKYKFFTYLETKRQMTRPGYVPTLGEIAARMQIRESVLEDIVDRLSVTEQVASDIAFKMKEKGDGLSEDDVLSMVADTSAGLTPEQAVIEREVRMRLWAEVSQDPDVEILGKRFEEDLTLSEIGEEVDLSRERVRQREGKALGRLRERLEDLR